MFTRPSDLTDDEVVRAVARGWRIEPDTATYAAVGFGSHHWHLGAGEDRWFVTVDDLDARLTDASDRRSKARNRLVAALETVDALADHGLDFVVAPRLSRRGGVAESLNDKYVIAVYPHVEGRSEEGAGGYKDVWDRMRVVNRLARLHTSGVETPAETDTLAIPRRAELELSIEQLAEPWEAGPYGERARLLVSEHRAALERILQRFDSLAAETLAGQPQVLTHGEPHSGNVIFTGNGPQLIDWDTVLVSTPERDLWRLIDEDSDVRPHYESLTGRRLNDSALAAHRLWWDLCEIALYTYDFRSVHEESADTVTAWNSLVEHLDPSRWTNER